jgi:ELWxxDGT repeat protein
MRGRRSWCRLVLAALPVVIPAPPAAAQAFRVKDIRPGNADSFPQAFAKVNFRAFFLASSESATAPVLWWTDGTLGGTELVQAIDPWPGGVPPDGLDHGPVGVEFQDRLFFAWSSSELSGELWSSDGTSAGTVRVTNVNTRPGPRPNLFQLTVAGNRLFFTASTFNEGTELWVTDGTAAGTFLVRDIEPGPGSGDPQGLTAIGGQLFFTAATTALGRELWRSDGTPQGTVIVADIVPGSPGSEPASLADLNGTALFAARPDASGPPRLWRSDGTPGGTALVGTVLNPSALGRVGGRVFFAGEEPGQGQELWTTDGTTAGTALVADLNPGPGSSTPGSFTDVQGAAFFVAHRDDVGRELWKSDGTAAGTALVKDLRPGPEGGGVTKRVVMDGLLLFSADDGSGRELWRSDGTSAGTDVLADINPGGSANVHDMVFIDDEVVFAALDGSHGYELWRTDGTTAGTRMVRDINVGLAGSRIFVGTELGGRLLFWADDGQHGHEPWMSDGTDAGTVLLRDLYPGGTPSAPWASTGASFFSRWEPLAGEVLFSAAGSGQTGAELWKTDGTVMSLVRDLEPGPASSDPRELIAAGPSVQFAATTAGAPALWKSDGTPAGTSLVYGFPPPPGVVGGLPADLARVGANTFMRSWDPVHGEELWVSDGTGAGTRLVKDIRPGPNSAAPALMTAVGDGVFFVADDGVHGRELWRSDGTEAGTVLVKDVLPVGSEGSFYRNLTAVGRRLFFVNDRGFPPGPDLWTSDGSEAGTVQLASFPRGALIDLTPLGADLAFGAGAFSVRDLWRSDGTVEGTGPVRPNQAPFDSVPNHLLPVAGGILASIPGDGLWWSDGTEEGTIPIDPDGPLPSDFTGRFMAAGPLVYYSADGQDGVGSELWAVPLSAMVVARVGDCAVGEGESGTRACDFVVSLSSPQTAPVTVDYATADGTAVAGADYVAASGTLTFAPGVTTQTVSVAVNGDTATEAHESFSLALSNGSGAVLVDATAAGTILDDEATRFYTLPACRALDTRGYSPEVPPIGANRQRTFPIAGPCALPSTAKAVVINVTAVNPGDQGDFRIYPAGGAAPLASAINFAAGRTRAGNAIVPLGADGALSVVCDMPPGSIATVDLVIDVYGYFQ